MIKKNVKRIWVIIYRSRAGDSEDEVGKDRSLFLRTLKERETNMKKGKKIKLER